jgi:ADP-ribosyl-[dinitrogen reductase] hydrolase
MGQRDAFLSLMAIGDAFGMKYEFVTHDQTASRDDLSYGPNPVFGAYPPSEYTDDTQMSLANAELLLSPAFSDAATLDNDALIGAWLKAFKRDNRLGYSQIMYGILETSADANEFRAQVNPKMGVTSGGAMRAGPFGLLPDVADALRLAEQQARITHDTVPGVNAAKAVALTVHHLHHGGSRANLPAVLADTLGADWNGEECGNTGHPNNGLTIVTQALNAIDSAASYGDVLLTGVNQSPHADTDTICALGMLFASRCTDLTNDLPPNLYATLCAGGGEYGLAYLGQVDAQLMRRFPA